MLKNHHQKIGNTPQVFVDGSLIESGAGVRLVRHVPRKTGEMSIVREHSWERERLSAYASVRLVHGKYHLWYGCHGENLSDACLALAVSEDGINWTKPMLGAAEQIDDGRNNIVLGYGAGGVEGPMPDSGCMVFIDPNAADGRNLCLGARGKRGADISLFRSADGIHWELSAERLLTDERKTDAEGNHLGGEFHLDSQNVVFWDDRIRRYVAYVRRNFDNYGQWRTVSRLESESLPSFPSARKATPVVFPDGVDSFAYSAAEGTHVSPVDYYTNATVKYQFAADAYFMFPTAYFKYAGRHLKEFKDNEPVNAGPVDVRFAASRDGVRWHRTDRSAFVGLGMKGAFDSGSIYLSHGIVPSPDGTELFLYYMGMDMLHGWNRRDKHHERNNRILSELGLGAEKNTSAFSRLVIRKDGFISAYGDYYRGGELTTPILVTDGGELHVNVNTSAVGELRAEILDENSMPLPGFAMNDCRVVHTTNSVDHVVRWSTERQGIPAGRPIRLRFRLRDAHLYQFQIS